MAWTGTGGARPSKAISWITAIVGIGMVLTVLSFFINPALGVSFFVVLWIVGVLCIVGYHLWNATSNGGVHMARFSFQANDNAQRQQNFAKRLRDLEQLRQDGLISQDEYERKRSEIMQARW